MSGALSGELPLLPQMDPTSSVEANPFTSRLFVFGIPIPADIARRACCRHDTDDIMLGRGDVVCGPADLVTAFRDGAVAEALRGAAGTLTVHWVSLDAVALVSAAASVGVRGIRVVLPWDVRSEISAEIRFADKVRTDPACPFCLHPTHQEPLCRASDFV